MAEDEGLVVNFAVNDVIFPTAAKFKGGPWRARRQANKAVKIRTSGATQPAIARDTQQELETRLAAPDERAPKRQKTAVPAAKDAQNGTTQSQPWGKGAPRKPADQRQVISSLFTYNPASTTSIDPNSLAGHASQEPSNAPLPSELDSFTKLGLSTRLSSHLLTKMDLKAPTAIQKAAIPRLLETDSDAFVQAQTGSGKTLAYLLPILQKIMALSAPATDSPEASAKERSIQRQSGLFAIILAPTRELSRQIEAVLENLLRSAHWIVSGTIMGGEKKKAEKARLRKGLNILVATPGRLADHLQNTEALDVSAVRWLVLDEGDRLMELGFEQDLRKIVSIMNLSLKDKRKAHAQGLPTRRTTVLCSATMKTDVERLFKMSLEDPIDIKVAPSGQEANDEEGEGTTPAGQHFTAPSQLQRSYAVVPAKLRLVCLIAVLKRAFQLKGSVAKAVVFFSCADVVDFHFHILSQSYKLASPDDPDSDSSSDSDSDSDSDSKSESSIPHDSDSDVDRPLHEKKSSSAGPAVQTEASSPLLSASEQKVTLYRLHGSLPQHLRTSTLRRFTNATGPSILLATDVASRGLDVPNVDLVIEFDPAFSHDDHLHRIGRTARAGRAGRTLLFLMPGPEESYVKLIRHDGGETCTPPARHDAAELLKRAFASSSSSTSTASRSSKKTKEKDYELHATNLQLAVERHILQNRASDHQNSSRSDKARQAFRSHVRAYATHVAAERHCFNVRDLHLGHLAKSFGLRETPALIGRARASGTINGPSAGLKVSRKEDRGAGGRRAMAAGVNGKSQSGTSSKAHGKGKKAREGVDAGGDQDEDIEKAAQKMRHKVREAWAKMRPGGGDASEFNLG